MIGLDTNTLVRYLLDDDPRWSPVVTRFLDETLTPEQPGYINIITLVELVWVLRGKPGYSRERLADLIENLLMSDSVVVGEAPSVADALVAFRAGSAGFADYLIAEINEKAGASATMTIDRKAGKTFPFTPLSPGA